MRALAILLGALALGGCAYEPPPYRVTGPDRYYPYEPEPLGRYVREQKCREVMSEYGHLYLDCRYVRRWRRY